MVNKPDKKVTIINPIAVVIPAYKVQDHILGVLEGIPDWVKYIVVVNDASPDNTTEALKKCKDRRLHIISHEKNQGVGGAVLSGYSKAFSLGAEIAVKMDGDGQMDPAYLPALVSPILQGEADYVKGNRFIHSTELLQMPFLRRVGNVALTFFVKVASGYWDIFDPTNGYTALERSAYILLSKDKLSKDYFFESNMLLELRRIRAVVKDIPIPSRYGSEKSSLSIQKVLVTFPLRLVRGFFNRNLPRILLVRFQRRFIPSSIWYDLVWLWIYMGTCEVGSVNLIRHPGDNRDGADSCIANYRCYPIFNPVPGP